MPPIWILICLFLDFSLPTTTKLTFASNIENSVSFTTPDPTNAYSKTRVFYPLKDIDRNEVRLRKLNKHTKILNETNTAESKNFWTKLEDYSLKRYLLLKSKGEVDELEREATSKRRKRKDNYSIPSSVTHYHVEKENNPYYKLLNSIANKTSDSFNDTSIDVDNLRVWKKHIRTEPYPSQNSVEKSQYLNKKPIIKFRKNNSNKYSYEKNRKYLEIEAKKDALKNNAFATTTTTSVSLIDPHIEMIKRFRREVADPNDVEGPCRPFVVGIPEQQTFFSPGYPDNYPNQTDCVVVLNAPPGFFIKLDFRDSFNIEPSEECKFDFLEVRDGAHGYSRQIGQFCGREFPDIVTSQGRYLWLHFHSDDNIEYSGFTAIYEFIPRPTTAYFQPEPEECRIEVGGSEGIINKSDIDPERIRHTIEYGIPLDCMWIITVDKSKKINLAFKKFNLQKPNDCDSNFVDIFSNRTDLPSRVKNFCGSIADSVESTTNVLHIRFMAESMAINSTFEALFTAFREKEKGQSCEEDELDCEDNTCIASDLRCNGRINCRFKWDEDECDKVNGSAWMQSEHIIIIMVVFSLILAGMSAAFVFNCIRKLISDHRIIQEHIRQSREGNIDELGRTSSKDPVSKISLKHESLSPKQSDDHLENIDCYVPGVGEILPILLQGNKRDRFIDHMPQNASMNNRNNENIIRQQSLQRQDYEVNIDRCGSNDQGIDVIGSTNVPEMCDSSCQTRESLFHTPAFSHPDSDRSFSPLPPSVDYSKKPIRPREVRSCESNLRPQSFQKTSTPFSTFGYSGGSMQRDDTRSSSNKSKDMRYTAEAVIEMENFDNEGNGNNDSNRNIDNKGNVLTDHEFEDHKNKNKEYDPSQTGLDRAYLTEENINSSKPHKKFDRRPYSVETTKSAPDVIIMTKSH